MGKRVGAVLATLGLSLGLAACGSDSNTDSSGNGGGGGGGGDSAETKQITLGIIPSWTDGLSTAYLWKNVLEGEGFEVKIQELSEAAPLYTGLAGGDVDVYPSAWPEVTHQSYMEEYGDQIEDLGAYYEGAKLTFAVPKYVDIDSIADLTGNADKFGGKIIGIEPGAGLTEVTKTSVMPKYDLKGDYELVTSSTQAMLAELQSAIDDKRDIVVTLWRPFWANNSFPVKDLKDPKGALGETEGLHLLARKGFSEDFPEVADMMSKAKLDDAQYGTLEHMVVEEYGEGKEAEAVTQWLKENPDWKSSLS